ncbi:glycoside hydrolase, putative [Bodo saltans]|uniref:Glycoside hydrolase, putative n=1 Tax=Bodo saltans TaxID=75058 RepID=A0A0S4J6E6_BODSA|nr:glycoside hydrolase, putative [Bodo saltans]|eukprot:CUG87021.1 glycoside hydrolase, putative [Bodo saltans]
MSHFSRFAVVALVATVALATDGGDISEYYGSGTFACCKNNGWDFVIVRSYCSFGGVDPNAPATLEQAAAGGIPYHDVYHFPCIGVNAATQVADDYARVAGKFGMMWFDIETNPSPNCGWSGDKTTNCNFMGALIAAGNSHGIHMGIYASAYMWESIMGGCTVGADNGIVLWYAHYDYTRSFGDFSPFGGWSKPNIKQYNDAVGICGINADADWYP